MSPLPQQPRRDVAGGPFCHLYEISARQSADQPGDLQYAETQANLKEFSPHDLRRTFAGDMLDRGVDIVTVQN